MVKFHRNCWLVSSYRCLVVGQTFRAVSHVLCALQANVGEAHVKEPAFIRALMTAICTSAITGIVYSLSSVPCIQKKYLLDIGLLNESAVYFGGTSLFFDAWGPKYLDSTWQ